MIKVPDDLIIMAIVLPVLGFGFWVMFEPWFKLSKTYGSKLTPPNILFEYENCLVGRTRYKRDINIGITKQGLFLSLTSPLSYVIQPLLINWDAITKTEPYFDSVWGNCYRFSIVKPTITTLVLTEEIYQKIQALVNA